MPQDMRSTVAALGRHLKPYCQEHMQGWVQTFTPPADFLGFQGHFPAHPVLPAVVQILMAEVTIARGTGLERHLKSVQQAKFLQPIPPHTPLLCRVWPLHMPENWQCQLVAGDTLVASFRLTFSPTATPEAVRQKT